MVAAAFNLLRGGGVPAQGGAGTTATPSAAEFLFVKQQADGEVIIADTAGEVCVGVSQGDLVIGEGATLATMGDLGLVECAEAINEMEPVATNASGEAVKAEPGDVVLGVCFIPSAADGDFITIMLGAPYVMQGVIGATVGVEAAVAADAIEVVLVLADCFGTAISAATEIGITAVGETANAAVLAAAGTPIGTLNFVEHPATGVRSASFACTAAGLCSFRVTNTNAEDVLVEVTADGFTSRTLLLTFA